MQNHNPLRKQTLGKMLDSQTIWPAYLALKTKMPLYQFLYGVYI